MTEPKTKPTLLIYIAGRFRGPTPWDVEKNIRAAEEVAFQVWSLSTQLTGGYVAALCPHMNCRHWDKTLSDDIWLAGGLALLSACDAVVLVPGWESSKGTVAEVGLARKSGLPVFYSWDQPEKGLADWAAFVVWARREIDQRR